MWDWVGDLDVGGWVVEGGGASGAAAVIMAVYSGAALNRATDKGIPDSICEGSLDILAENEWHSHDRRET